MQTKQLFCRLWQPTLLALLTGVTALSAHADEGGVSFWLPGQFGSFSAVPVEQGWSLGTVYYHVSSDAGTSRELPIGGQIVAGLEVESDILILAPSYALESPIWDGGQLSLSLIGLVGDADVKVDATLTGPNGDAVSANVSDSTSGIGDLYPTATVRWNDGVDNYMVYAMAGVPVGEYSVDKLANLGTNHWSADIGGGYTYLNTESGLEFSAVVGATYSFENPDTKYQNGISAHIDWALSQFLSEAFHIGAVGYFYQQVTGDSGDGAVLGDFRSSGYAAGPELGWFFKDGAWYLNVKAYYEFETDHRPKGWNSWLTLSMPL